MAKKEVLNSELVEQIVKEGSQELKDTLGMESKIFKNSDGSKTRKTTFDVDLKDGKEVFKALNSYEPVKNEFINALVNKIVKTQFFSKVFNNPLKEFHHGLLPFGSTIEDIFVERSKKYGFKDHFKVGGNAENDLIGSVVPDVKVFYHTKNYEYKYKVSVSDQQLKTAFTSENGLSKLCQDLINSNLNGAYIDEYYDMKNIMFKKELGTTSGDSISKGFIQRLFDSIGTNTEKPEMLKSIKLDTKEDLENTMIELKTGILDFNFPSSERNLANVLTFTNKEDLVIFMDTKTSAKISVKLLANAFNISEVEVNNKIVVLDRFPDYTVNINSASKKVTPKIILADKNIMQVWDTINTSKTFDNGNGLYTNYFMHKQGIMSFCEFSQFVVFADII